MRPVASCGSNSRTASVAVSWVELSCKVYPWETLPVIHHFDTCAFSGRWLTADENGTCKLRTPSPGEGQEMLGIKSNIRDDRSRDRVIVITLDTLGLGSTEVRHRLAI